MRHTMFNTPVLKSVLRCIALCLLKISGWKATGSLPQDQKYIIIVAPHTSNWDLFFAILLAFALKVDGRYIAKRELFRGPFAWLMSWSGAIPVDRSSSHHIVDQMVSVFKGQESFVLALAPEGTRRRKDYWKSGFYHIALDARVPILLAFLDYARKTGGAGPLIYPTGNLEQDIGIIREFYLTVTGKHPENTSPAVIRLK